MHTCPHLKFNGSAVLCLYLTFDVSLLDFVDVTTEIWKKTSDSVFVIRCTILNVYDMHITYFNMIFKETNLPAIDRMIS